MRSIRLSERLQLALIRSVFEYLSFKNSRRETWWELLREESDFEICTGNPHFTLQGHHIDSKVIARFLNEGENEQNVFPPQIVYNSGGQRPLRRLSTKMPRSIQESRRKLAKFTSDIVFSRPHQSETK